MKIAIIIPARFQSVRFPGKPLALIDNKPMIIKVVEQCVKVASVDEIWVATDDLRIAEAVETYGYKYIMTSNLHSSGTDRLYEANQKVMADIVINVQGDEPFINPDHIEKAIERLLSSEQVDMVTLATPFTSMEDVKNPNYPKVVLNENNDALYFSRAVIPFSRDNDENALFSFYLKHIGLYGYRKPALEKMATHPPVLIEKIEQLEQLRALFLGLTIGVEIVDRSGFSIDTPQDLEMAIKSMEED